MDYRRCKKNAQFFVQLCIRCMAAGGLVSALFYRSWWGMLSVFVLLPFFYRYGERLGVRRQQAQLKSEFREVMVMVSGGLNAGYSLENAFLAVRKTADREYPLMDQELSVLAGGLSCRKRIETLLLDFGRRSGIPEILEFAGLIETAKVYGGNIPQLIRQLTANFADTEMIEAEIETMVAAKKLEGRIMLAVPFGILLYFQLLNPSYIQVLYTTLAGRLCMTVCIGIVSVCAGWIEKIVRIEV